MQDIVAPASPLLLLTEPVRSYSANPDDPVTSLLDLQPDLICIVASHLADKAGMRSTCRRFRDIVYGTATSLQWRQEVELHALPAGLLAKLPSLSRMDFRFSAASRRASPL